MDYLSIITDKYKSHVKDKWREIYSIMAVHTQAVIPTDIFRKRRPLESENDAILGYRKDNHRPVTKDEFDKAISDYITTAMGIDVTVDYSDSDVLEYEKNIELKDGFKTVTLKDYIIKKIGSYKQTDPNACIAVIPKHTDIEFIPNFNYEIPDFNTIRNKKIDIEIVLVTHNNIIYSDSDTFIFRAGKYKYGIKNNEETDYYYVLTKEQTYLIYPIKGKERRYDYVQHPLYANNLKQIPVINIGSKKIIEQYDSGDVLEYFVSDYHGAAAWGDLFVGQNSDLQVCEVRYVYPRHWRIKVACNNIEEGCHIEKNKYVTDNGETCSVCKGTGYIMDTTPMGTMMIDKGGLLYGNDGKFQQPEGFITPPTDILKHSADRSIFYFEKMLSSLCVLNQNMTNQSAQAKSYDVSHKVDLVTRIVMDLYIQYENVLNIIDMYRGGTGMINIGFPENFDVRNQTDLLTQINQAKAVGAPYVILVELTKRYLIKNFGDSEINIFIVEYLSKYDKLFAYGLDEIQTVKSIFGSDITQLELLLHTQGYQILKELIQNDSTLLEKDFEYIKLILDKELQKYVVPLSTNNVL